jgi:hypothetical protein
MCFGASGSFGAGQGEPVCPGPDVMGKSRRPGPWHGSRRLTVAGARTTPGRVLRPAGEAVDNYFGSPGRPIDYWNSSAEEPAWQFQAPDPKGGLSAGGAAVGMLF